MTVKEAIVIFAKQFPDKAVVGYWDKPNGIVLNTQSITAGLTAPAQYLVTDDGQIYGTNPMRSNLSPGDMKKLIIPWTMPQTLNRVCGFFMPKIQHTEQRHNFIKRGLEVRDYGNCIWFQAETCLERFFG